MPIPGDSLKDTDLTLVEVAEGEMPKGPYKIRESYTGYCYIEAKNKVRVCCCKSKIIAEKIVGLLNESS